MGAIHIQCQTPTSTLNVINQLGNPKSQSFPVIANLSVSSERRMPVIQTNAKANMFVCEPMPRSFGTIMPGIIAHDTPRKRS